jgi:hypothetical protein
VKYVILIYSNPESRKMWESFSAEEQAGGLAYYAALSDELAGSGELVASERLADPSETVRIPPREGAAITSDGPFAEVKEHLAGFYLLDCASADRAVEIAHRIPEAEFGLVEVRPVHPL